MEKYWKSIEKNTPERSPVSHANRKQLDENESLLAVLDDKTLQSSSSRRDFLKLFGFSLASAAVVASCETPVRKAIPYLIRPEEITPGKANYYATTFFDGDEYCSILAKVRDGRPIKIEGNTLSSITKGGTSARVQASVLSLYDDARYKSPLHKGNTIDWETLDKDILTKLDDITTKGQQIVLVSSTISSPSAISVIEKFLAKYPTARHIEFDAISASGILSANEISFGKKLIPSYNFDKARIIVSFGADFLGTWLSPVEYTKQYVTTRSLTEGQTKLSKHIHFESGLSLTGSNADQRLQIKPSQEKAYLISIYNALAKSFGYPTYSSPEIKKDVSKIVEELKRFKGQSLVVSGSNDTKTQVLVNAINYLLDSYGKTIDLDNPLKSKAGIDSQIDELSAAIEKEIVGGVIFYNVNPAYILPESISLTKHLDKLDLSVSLNSAFNETSELVEYISPGNHYLESWGDSEIKPGKYSLSQPAIRPIFNTRQAEESLLKWAGIEISFHEYLKSYWEEKVFPQTEKTDFFKFWNSCLHDGVFETENQASTPVNFNIEALNEAAKGITSGSDQLEFELYQKVGIGSGLHANNPWLQELPDPVTKATWDNYACISKQLADEKNLKDGDLVLVNGTIELPILIQPGQEYQTISIALGYGRKVAGKVAEDIGKNAYPLSYFEKKSRNYAGNAESIEKVGRGYKIALTQTHHDMMGRDIIRETSLDEYLKDPSSGNHRHEEVEKLSTSPYPKHEYKGHHWGMAIDMNKCIGCSACVVACSAENNVPVVGKNEVLRAHEMHWIRIDRYYNGGVEDPETVRQPMICQHCDNAPCENVCPVAATNHSDEGLNQMAYNRCIGTRYCNNNCPYKVRRFNWFDYTTADAIKNNTVDPTGMTLDLKRMVLNPDVTIRAKGVIEKCSFCVQRIQESKLTAKLENRLLKDGDIKPACQQSCPADAIVFGDLNNSESIVSKYFKDPRNYHVLEELHVLPSVGYLTKVRNKEENKA